MNRADWPAGLAARRDRIRDEHMYRVDEPGLRTTFRLQVFTADAGPPPVVVATQTIEERGISLVNGCAQIASLVWREQFANRPQPPMWVQRIIADDELSDTGPMGGWQLVQFEVLPDHTLTEPTWLPITQRQLDRILSV